VFLASTQQDANLTLVDGDRFEPSNASRMLFGSCGMKARVIARELVQRLGDSRLRIESTANT
jgi:hypothetical protein